MSPRDYINQQFSTDRVRRCWMCSCVLTPGTATVDHLKPKSRGGRNVAGNYRLACGPCNAARGNKRIPRDQMAALKGRQRPKGRDLDALSEAIRRHRAT